MDAQSTATAAEVPGADDRTEQAHTAAVPDGSVTVLRADPADGRAAGGGWPCSGVPGP